MVEMIPIELIIDNELSVNEEDTATFNRLVEEIKKYGIVEIPTGMFIDDEKTKVKLISGHHRVRAAKEAGYKDVPIHIKKFSFSDREEEFNVVNNMNTIKGEMRGGQLMKKIRENNLDPTKLDVFKFPTAKLFPRLTEVNIQQKMDAQKRLASITKSSYIIAKEIAQSLYDERDELVTVLIVKDRPSAVIRLPLKTKGDGRKYASDLKRILYEAIVNTDFIQKLQDEEGE